MGLIPKEKACIGAIVFVGHESVTYFLTIKKLANVDRPIFMNHFSNTLVSTGFNKLTTVYGILIKVSKETKSMKYIFLPLTKV